MCCVFPESPGRLYDVGQEEAFRTELLMSRSEDGIRRPQSQLSRSSLYPGDEPHASVSDLQEAMKSNMMDISSLQSRKAKVRDRERIYSCLCNIIDVFNIEINHVYT